jgi:uncharacterized membrane protein HdeD (DUF308 family)
MSTRQTAERTLDHAFMIGGIIALAFGATLLLRREATMSVSALLLGLWWLIHAALILVTVLIDREDSTWKVAVAVLGGAAGFTALIDPVQTEAFLDGLLSLVLGVIGIAVAGAAFYGGFRGGGMSSMLFGVVSGAIGAVLLLYPDGSYTMFVTVIGVVLLVHGIVAIAIAVNAKGAVTGVG